MNELHFGDNLDVLQNQIKDESVDLIYLDPPFNSNINFNVLFKEGEGIPSEAQAEAFRDTWAWGHSAAVAYENALRSGGDVAILLQAFRSWLGESGMMAYLAMMAARMLELRRVLKPSGSVYLHCDPTASHYLKLLLDAIFGGAGFRNEIVWKRTPFAGSSKSRARQLPRSHDNILFYTNGPEWTWNGPTAPYSEKYLTRFKWNDGDGRGPYRKTLLKTYSQETFDRLESDNRLILPIRQGAKYSYKQYLNESRGQTQIDDIWCDINALNPVAIERVGYPTQKPVALLKRIIAESSNPGDVVLDPFCGCGTTVEAANEMDRQWVGIDVTHYAITLIERRLKKADKPAAYKVHGRPTDLAGARDLAERDKYQFQWWAAWMLGAQTYETKKGGDRGIDGNIFYANGPYGYGRIIISVKGGENLNPGMVRDLGGVIQRENAEMGILITLAEPTRGMMAEAAGYGFVKRTAHEGLPRLQIATVEDLIDRRMPILPPLPKPAEGARATGLRKKRDRDQMELMLPFAGVSGLRTEDGNMIDPAFLDLAQA